MKITDKKIVDDTKLNMDEWLALFNSPDKENLLFIDYMFPTDTIKDKYLETIHTRTDKEVINLLRNFLIPSGSLGCDEDAFLYLMYCMENDEYTFNKLMEVEYYKRLIKGIFNKKFTPWEGNTWVIDLLPHYPKLALDALYAYFIAHIQLLPDGRWDGLQDSMALIRAKFIEAAHPVSLLLSLDPYQFEHLIDALYNKMGYVTTLTPRTYDKGRDIIAAKIDVGEKEKLLIQCKRTKNNVGVKEIRALLGVVSNEKATKGVLVSTSKFTAQTKKFVEENSRLELIDQRDIHILLNKFFGSNWPTHIDFIISQSLSKYRSEPFK